VETVRKAAKKRLGVIRAESSLAGGREGAYLYRGIGDRRILGRLAEK